ncbi:hypothetical protein ABZ387_36455 [Streptomyces flaveolus]
MKNTAVRHAAGLEQTGARTARLPRRGVITRLTEAYGGALRGR